MEKEINIAAILRDKPENTKLYSRTYGECYFKKVYDYNDSNIYVADHDTETRYNKNGKFSKDGEMLLLPSKSMQDWEKFAWKKGDVLYAESIDNYCIFNKFTDDEYTSFEGKFLFDARNLNICNPNYFNENTDEFVKVSDDNAKIVLSDLGSLLGGKLNLDTLTIEQPQFKDGDIVVIEDNGYKALLIYKCKDECFMRGYVTIVSIDGDNELRFNNLLNSLGRCVRLATDSEKQKLFAVLEKEGKRWNSETKTLEDLPKKCEFKPFDKVLVRDTNDDIWTPILFAEYDKNCTNDYLYGVISSGCGIVYYKQCIPYNEETKHLLGTTDEWEGGE